MSNKKNSKNSKNNKAKAKVIKVKVTATAETGKQNTSAETPAKRGVGRPRTLFKRVVAYVIKEDGTVTRRTKGKPNSKHQIKFYSVDWNYKDSALPENAVEVAKPEKKVKIEAQIDLTPVEQVSSASAETVPA